MLTKYVIVTNIKKSSINHKFKLLKQSQVNTLKKQFCGVVNREDTIR